MRYRVLHIDSHSSDRELVTSALSSQSCTVISVETVARALEVLESDTEFHIVLLDITLSDGDGLKLLSKILETKGYHEIPVVIVSKKNTIADKIVAFNAGAEDYITKPFDPIELKLRIEARAKKHVSRIAKSLENTKLKDEIIVDNLRIDPRSQRVFIPSRRRDHTQTEIKLTPTEFKLLYHLVSHPDEVLTRNQLLNAVWGESAEVFDRTVDSHVKSLRQKIRPISQSLETVHGVGYIFTRKKAVAA